MHIHRRWLMTRVSFIAITSVWLSGCAISPKELAPDEIDRVATSALTQVSQRQDDVTGPITLDHAIARALRFNLDHQVELAELAVRERELNLAHYSLLPNLVANSGYASRDVVNASSSQNALTGIQSLATSTSQDLRLRTADAAFGWSILDFGLSYVRARQAADKVLVQNELRRKLALRLMEDTRAAFWRAASAQRLLRRLEKVEQLARSVESEARQIAGDRQSSPIAALTYEREIVEIQRTLAEVKRELNVAHTQLAALINIPPGTRFTVVAGSRAHPKLPSGSMAELIYTAVSNRPEMREVAYRQRINEHEANAALLELLPGLNFYAGSNFDSNSFLLHDHWKSWGARASWNLLKVFSYPARRAVVEEQDELLAKKSMAIAMAIITQVYVGRIRYVHAVKEHDIAKRYREVQARLLEQIRIESDANRISRQTLAREELNAIVAEAKLDLAYAGVQAAYAYAMSSMGSEPAIDAYLLPTASIQSETRVAHRADPH